MTDITDAVTDNQSVVAALPQSVEDDQSSVSDTQGLIADVTENASKDSASVAETTAEEITVQETAVQETASILETASQEATSQEAASQEATSTKVKEAQTEAAAPKAVVADTNAEASATEIEVTVTQPANDPGKIQGVDTAVVGAVSAAAALAAAEEKPAETANAKADTAPVETAVAIKKVTPPEVTTTKIVSSGETASIETVAEVAIPSSPPEVGVVATDSNAKAEVSSPKAISDLVQNYPGQLTMVVFWSVATETESPSFAWLNEMHDRYAKSGLRIMAVNQGTAAREGEAFAVKQGAQFEVAHDRSGELRRALWVGKLPATYLLNDAGELLGSHVGFNDEIRGSYEDEIRRLLRALGS